jgi:hypothetical protein
MFGPVCRNHRATRRGACRSKEVLKDIAWREKTEDAEGLGMNAADSGEGKDVGEARKEAWAYKSFLRNTGQVRPRQKARLARVMEESRIFSWVSRETYQN